MRRRRLGGAIAVAALAAVSAAVEPASACSCARGDPRAALQRADAAFVGAVTERREKRPEGPFVSSADPVTLVFSVERVMKGDLGRTVEVETVSSGASCGIEVPVGGRTGLFLTRDGSRWTSSLCAQIEPDRLLEAAQPLPPPLGGPIALLLGGRLGPARTVALDTHGRTLAYGNGDGETALLAVCPRSQRAVEAVVDAGGRWKIAVRNLRTFHVVRAVRLRSSRRGDSVGALACHDRLGHHVVVFVLSGDGFGTRARVLRLGAQRPVWRGTALAAGFGRSRAYLATGPRGDRLVAVELATGRAARPIRVPPSTGALTPSPDGSRLAGIAYSPPLSRSSPPSRAVLVEFDRRRSPLVRTAPLGQSNVTGDIVWLENGNRLVFFPDGETDDVRVYDTALRVVERWSGWRGRGGVILRGEAYGIGWPETLIAAPLPRGPARVVRRLPSPVAHVLAAVPDAPDVQPTGGSTATRSARSHTAARDSAGDGSTTASAAVLATALFGGCAIAAFALAALRRRPR